MTAKIKVYVEGQSGTTGLKINERLAAHPYVEVMKIEEERRKDPHARREMINSADVVFICLPDDAAREAANMVAEDNRKTRLIDASTAHRTHSDWTYGLPELSRQAREEIQSSRRVAVPGCHATAFILPLYPLVKQGIVPVDYPIASHSITGYSGGGKQLIAEYTDVQRQALYPDHDAPREYALGQKHKHLPEMQKAAGLAFIPSFSPIVADYIR
jgi:N-acetyl-gamma-glutamyl-phosphate reductase